MTQPRNNPAIHTDKPIPYDIPVFDDHESERRHRKERLAAAFRIFGRFGFSEGEIGRAHV